MALGPEQESEQHWEEQEALDRRKNFYGESPERWGHIASMGGNDVWEKGGG